MENENEDNKTPEPYLPNPSVLPEVPDGFAVDPMRLTYHGRALFIPANKLQEGADFLGEAAPRDIVGALAESGDEANRHCQMVPNAEVITEMLLDLDVRCTIAPQAGDDPFYDPPVEVEEIVEGAPDAIVINGMGLASMRAVGFKVYYVYLSEPVLNHIMEQFGKNTPLQVKLATAAGHVAGVGHFAFIAPYLAAFTVPKLFHGRVDSITKELVLTIKRVMRQSRAIELQCKRNENA